MGKKNKMKIKGKRYDLGEFNSTVHTEAPAQTWGVDGDASRSNNSRSDDSCLPSKKKQSSAVEDNCWNNKTRTKSNIPIKAMEQEHTGRREEPTFASTLKSTQPNQGKVESGIHKSDRTDLQSNTFGEKYVPPTKAIVTKQPSRKNNDVNPSQGANCSGNPCEISQQCLNSKERDLIDIEKLIEDTRMSKLKIHEVQGDLFSAPESYSLCHCVAEDLSMSSGIAVAFKEKFKRVEELMQQRQKTGGLAILQDNTRYIYYLVTKEMSRGKPTLQTLFESLMKMRNHMKEQDVTKLAMPTIGCGLDRLDWSKVSKLIRHVFRDDDIEVVVYMLEQRDTDEQQSPTDRRPCRVVERPCSLVNIEKGTILLFIASLDHDITVPIKDLNEKYNFIMDYKQDKNNTLGENFYVTKKNELIVGMYCKEKVKDFFSYIDFVQCLKKLQRYVRKNKMYLSYIGIDSFTDDHDELIMPKLNVLFRIYSIFEPHICHRDVKMESLVTE